MALNTAQVKARIGDELGLTDDDLARLYGVDPGGVDKHLASLGKDVEAVYQRILSDVDGVRTGYRVLQVSDDHIAAIRALLRDYIFHPLVSMEMADGRVGWKLGSELVDVAMGKKDLKWPEWPQKGGTDAEREELLKRKFPKMSDD